MVIDTNIMIATVVFLLIVWIVSWIMSSHRFKTLIFLGLYLAAISPGLIGLLSSFTLDELIMVWFDSVLIYILFSIYLCAIIVMLLFEKGWLQKKWKWSASIRKSSPSRETMTLVAKTVERDLRKTSPMMDAGDIEAIINRDERLMRKHGIPPTHILEEHHRCLAEAEEASTDKGRSYFGCRVREDELRNR